MAAMPRGPRDAGKAGQAEAEAQRRHEAAERQAREAAELRAERVALIREWREGLAKAHPEYAEWYAKKSATGPKPASINYAPEPNIVGLAWFRACGVT